MRILLVNTSERIGGAAVACHRLMEALKNNGIKAKMLVRDKQTDQLTVVPIKGFKWMQVWRFLWERFCIWSANRFGNKENLFSVDIANTGTDITRIPEFQEADIIHLHWINQGMLSLSDIERILESGKPVVWTMHDMWPCTGICHHARICVKYQTECTHCQYLIGGGSRKDLSNKIFHKKKDIYKEHDITFVTCSEWLRDLAERSALLKGQTVTNIPNPINTKLFRPINKDEARTRLGLPTDKKLILFGSVKITDKRKGIDYSIESCRLITEQYPKLKDEWGVVVLGNHSEQLASMLPFKSFSLSYVADERRIADIYNAVDAYVTPSLEENLPNTIMEAMACGVPCVGFNVGGIPEMIDHLHNGYVALYRDARDFANGMHWVLTGDNCAELGNMARRKVEEEYSENAIARRYIDIYNKELKS
jgi:glycosyltransferase involved in cell wall biosynthesis